MRTAAAGLWFLLLAGLAQADPRTEVMEDARRRQSSGTAWVPETAPMQGVHVRDGNFDLMVQGNFFLSVDAQATDRGDTEAISTNWLMLQAGYQLGDGELVDRVMLSLEPATVGRDGYPLLLQTGENLDGQPIHDRQHPHDLFMELAAAYRRPIWGNSGVGIEIYGGLAGEPALGPPSYTQRASAMADPAAPLGHHWQDSTHITYGLLTAGIFYDTWKLEASLFNGREPDDTRTNLDLRWPDSASVRLTAVIAPELVAQASFGYLGSPDALDPDEDVQRITASAIYEQSFGSSRWASTAVFGANIGGNQEGMSGLVEALFDLDGHHVFFGRAEIVQKSAGALGVQGPSPSDLNLVESLALGYQYAFGAVSFVRPAIGVRAAVELVPDDLERLYGTRFPVGAFGYVQLTAVSGGVGKHEHDEARSSTRH